MTHNLNNFESWKINSYKKYKIKKNKNLALFNHQKK